MAVTAFSVETSTSGLIPSDFLFGSCLVFETGYNFLTVRNNLVLQMANTQQDPS